MTATEDQPEDGGRQYEEDQLRPPSLRDDWRDPFKIEPYEPSALHDLAPKLTHEPGYGTRMAEDARDPGQRQSDHERLRKRGAILAARLGEDQAVPPFQAQSYQGDCGLDLAITCDVIIEPGNICNLPCGVAVALPPGTFGWITGRSSTWSKWGLQVMPGVIDEGWRGELKAMVYRPVLYPAMGEHRLRVPAGTRLAQIIVLPNLVAQTQLFRVAPEDLPGSDRGTQGFGSTG